MSYDNFESADSAIAAMSGQFLCGKPIDVQYAFKSGSKTERHGSVAERILAANRPNYIGGMYNMMTTATAYTNYMLQSGAGPSNQGQLMYCFCFICRIPSSVSSLSNQARPPSMPTQVKPPPPQA